MGELIVVAPAAAATGFRLAGVRVECPPDAAGAEAALRARVAARRADVVAVHAAVWAGLPESLQAAATAATAPLVVPLPDDAGSVPVDHFAALAALLGRAVGYEIAFTPTGGDE